VLFRSQELPNAATADLSISLRAATTSVVGHYVTYHLHIANHGPASAADVRVHFSLPLGTTFVSVSGNGLLDANRDSVRWRFPALASGVTTTLTVTLLMDQSKSMRAQSSIRSTTPDPNLGNNWSSTVTRVS